MGFFLFRTGLYRRVWRDRALIVVFHRVDDALAGDPLTCTEQEFASYCDFLSRYFRVIPLSVMLDRLATGSDISRTVAITFDDGYKDNRTVAGRLLERRGLPASFFVATSFIGSDIVPWWDTDLSVASAWMTWEDVRWLGSSGFEIGAHTENHADLGEVVGEAARAEIVGAGVELERKLGTPTTLFSYPYGGPQHLRDENRDRVRAAGYRCCLSAHGGVVTVESDPFRLNRYPVSPPFHSVYHLGFDVLRQPSRSRREPSERTSDLDGRPGRLPPLSGSGGPTHPARPSNAQTSMPELRSDGGP